MADVCFGLVASTVATGSAQATGAGGSKNSNSTSGAVPAAGDSSSAPALLLALGASLVGASGALFL